jgi:hypothetical protein
MWGSPPFSDVTKPELFKGLTVGERMSEAVKVIDMPVPELKKPLDKTDPQADLRRSTRRLGKESRVVTQRRPSRTRRVERDIQKGQNRMAASRKPPVSAKLGRRR